MRAGMCERCEQRPATVHVTHVINGQKTEHRLCEVCAQATGNFPVMGAWGIGPLFGGLFTPSRGAPSEAQGVRCPRCGWTPAELQQTGRMGCDYCYTAFGPAVHDLARRIHGSGEHRGKIPARVGGSLRREQELETLKARLAQAIRDEAFEQAAELRDRIRALEQQQQGGSR
jgi:protein arginine kinase activator